MTARDTRPLARFQERTSRKADRSRAVRAFAAVLAAALVTGIVVAMLGSAVRALPVGAGILAVGLLLIDGIMCKPGGIPCLTWHSVSADSRWLPWAAETSVAPDTLDRQLSLIRWMGLEVIDTRRFIEMRREGQPVPANAVMLHFDDGYLDNFIAAAPILQKHGVSATLFVSLDFVAPDRDKPAPIDIRSPGPLGRTYAGAWDGYMSWHEIAALDGGAFGGVFDVQPHGVDHGRVPIGQESLGELTAQNWRALAWMQWAGMPGAKHDWYRHGAPPAVALGTKVPPSESALVARAWKEGSGFETEAAFHARVLRDFHACFESFELRLNKVPEIFCWPQNRATQLSRAIAEDAGFLATTAGRGCNRSDESPAIISRLHVGENAAGVRSRVIDDIAFRASIRAFQGNHYWYLVLLPVHLLKKLRKGAAGRRGAAVARSRAGRMAQ